MILWGIFCKLPIEEYDWNLFSFEMGKKNIISSTKTNVYFQIGIVGSLSQINHDQMLIFIV